MNAERIEKLRKALYQIYDGSRLLFEEFTDLLSLLDEKAAQIKAGDADEDLLADLENVRVWNLLPEGWDAPDGFAEACNLAETILENIKTRLAAGSPKAAEQIDALRARGLGVYAGKRLSDETLALAKPAPPAVIPFAISPEEGKVIMEKVQKFYDRKPAPPIESEKEK